MHWLPLGLMGGLYVCGAILLSLIGLAIVRRVVAHHVLAAHNDVAGFIYATVAVTYAVMLGFVTITAWEQFDAARDNADHEANVVADLYRLTAWFPETDRLEIRSALSDYATSVIDDEWEAMAERAAPSATTDAALDQLWDLYGQIEPGQGGALIAFADSVDRLQDLGNARRMRLLESESGIPGILWFGLIAGGAITVAYTFGFGVERGESHAVMLVTVAALIALLLFMVSSLNYPFHGDVRLEPDGMKLIARQFQLR